MPLRQEPGGRKAVCRECKGGWNVGEGRIAGVKAADVKGMTAQQVVAMVQQMHPAHAAAHRAPMWKGGMQKTGGTGS